MMYHFECSKETEDGDLEVCQVFYDGTFHAVQELLNEPKQPKVELLGGMLATGT